MTTVAAPPPAPPAAPPRSVGGGGNGNDRNGSGGLGGPWAILFVLVVFAILAAIVYVNNGNPELRRVDLVAQEYADAWVNGSLSDLQYDKLSGPAVDNGDAGKVADSVRAIEFDLDGKGELRPAAVQVDREATRIIDPDNRTLATTQLRVTWNLARTGMAQYGHVWTYTVPLQERQDGGRWRVVWTPQSVHPVIRHGLVFRVQRALAPRAPVIGAGDTALPPDTNPTLAKAVLGSIATKATAEQAQLAPLHAEQGDKIGIAGLQNIYDERLAGGAQIIVTAGLAQGFSGIVPTQEPLFVGAPETPTPIQLTLDARTQGWTEAALSAVAGPATLVVAKASTGEVLAVANTSTTLDYGLSSQQPPGPLFGIAAYLALVRQGFTATSQVDCRQPFTFPGAGQMFRNSQGPTINQVRLAAAIEGGCTTALARLSTAVTPDDLQRAVWDLGFATPLTAPDPQTPGWKVVADQLGTPAYLGRVQSDSATDDTSAVAPVHHAQDLVGEGRVLVSPLSVTRATVTVASGQRQSMRLITNPAPGESDSRRPLSAEETRLLQDVMAKSVTEPGGSAHALFGMAGSPVYAMAATAGYGTGRTDVRPAWVTGYRGDYAFTVLIPNARAADGARNALEVARRFLLNIP
ncbi:MAG TPA: penicillin-binding transpeptidase domain-containing protein [Kineosporiaceae bacterium]